MAKANKIRVLIADDHAILRSGLRMLIASQPDMSVIAEAQNGREAIALCGAKKPDVVILDITMPETGGLQAISEILRHDPEIKVLLLTMHEEPTYLKTALGAGASGYVLKKSVDADLLSAIRVVNKGGSYVDSELATSLLRHTFSETERVLESKLLSDRELQVLKLVAEGFSSREIAQQIFISTKTVETYRGRFAEKLGLKSRADIVRYALENGLLSSQTISGSKK